jgi:hypothetical protein
MKRNVSPLDDGGERITYDFTAEEIDGAHYLDGVDDETLGRLTRTMTHDYVAGDISNGIRLSSALLVFVRYCAEQYIDNAQFEADDVRLSGNPVGRWRLSIESLPDDKA